MSDLDFLSVLLVGLLTVPVALLYLTTVGRHIGWAGALIVGATLPSGMMWLGYTIWDEVFIAVVLLAYLVQGNRQVVPDARREKPQLVRLHEAAFTATVAYFSIQAVRGALLSENPLQMRWFAFFLMMGLASAVLGANTSSRKLMVPTVLASVLAYLLLYLLHGVSGQVLRGQHWGDLQLREWGTAAYALFPIAVAAPALHYCLVDQDHRYRGLAWVTLAVMIFVSMYYDSRVAMISILAIIVASAASLGLKRMLGTAALLAVTVVAVFGLVWKERTAQFVLDDLLSSGGAVFAEGPGGRDRNRQIMAEASFPAISGSLETFLFGHGLRQGGSAVAPYIYDLYFEYLPAQVQALSDRRIGVESFTTFVVETGTLGLGLLVVNLALVFVQNVRRRPNKTRIISSLSLALIVGWTFVINLFDMALLYFALMPSGLLLLTNESVEENELVAAPEAFSDAFHCRLPPSGHSTV